MLASTLIELVDYRQFNITDDMRGVPLTESELNERLDKIAKRNVVTTEVDIIEDGDSVVLDIKGDRDELNRNNLTLTIGLGLFDVEVEKQLIGMEKGETRSLKWKEQEDVVVEVKSVKRRSLAELTDNIISSLNIDGVNTVEEYKKSLLEEDLREKRLMAVTRDAIDYVLNNSKFNIAEQDISYLYDLTLKAYRNLANKEEMTLEEMAERYFRKSEEELKTKIREDLYTTIKYVLIAFDYDKDKPLISIIKEEYEKQVKEDSRVHAQTLEEAKEKNPYDYYMLAMCRGLVQVRIHEFCKELL
ncbi:hypothetical protein GCM10008014_15200 [Paenibacillus silvae]|uniref:Trigger factor n=1 Tax=Paenibacillus silvae TaxID=1325358 RepID=A0ABQ1Z705_9BACL|nr:hypothetical protein [Paenibacillus silvae]GGH50237.1 hypothetical protein GCM10008014_15200 [Paenibacillus silvae]